MTYAKKAIPKSLKTAVWLTYVGKQFEIKCHVAWCKTLITPFTFETGHNIPESKGGLTSVENLRPICGQCNKSMGNRYTIDEFSRIYAAAIQSPSNNQIVKKQSQSQSQSKKPGFLRRLGNCLRMPSMPNPASVAPEPYTNMPSELSHTYKNQINKTNQINQNESQGSN
jgi:hypothetical protein